MHLANAMLALGGDTGNQVPKFQITPSEIAVLRLIHGDESVTDIEPIGEVKRSHKVERQRLMETYGRSDETGKFECKPVDTLFPGVAARLFETLDELEIPEDFFKPASRLSSAGTTEKQRASANRSVVDALAEEVIEPIKPLATAPESEAGDEDDGIGDMPPVGGTDEDLFK